MSSKEIMEFIEALPLLRRIEIMKEVYIKETLYGMVFLVKDKDGRVKVVTPSEVLKDEMP